MNNDTGMINVYGEQKRKRSKKDIKAMKRRRKIRRIKNAFRMILLLICILLSLYVIFEIIHGNKLVSMSETNRIIGTASEENLTKPKIYTDTATRNTLAKLAETSTEYQEIYDNIDTYPEELLAALCSNSEMLEFTLGYTNKDSNVTGEFTEEELKEEYPLLIQWDKRWGYESFGDSCIGLAGCAPTCMSMVILALTDNTEATPDIVAIYAQDAGYYAKGTGTSWSFMTEGASHFGINGNELCLSESSVFSELQLGHPIICSMSPGDFTTQGHFIVLVGEEDGKIMVNDPNNRERSSLLWDYDVLEGQIKNLWAFSN